MDDQTTADLTVTSLSSATMSPPSEKIVRIEGTTLPEAERLHRIDVAYALLQEGIPFNILRNPLGALRRLLQYGRGKLPLNFVSAVIPVVLQQESLQIQKELKAAGIFSFAFDGKLF